MLTVAARYAQADREILAHPIHCKAEIELDGRHGLVTVLHLPRLSRTLGDRLDQRHDVEAGALGEMDGFGQALDQPGYADLVYHFGELTGARRAQQPAGARVGGDHRLGPRERLLVAAAHHCEYAVDGTGLAARNRGVDEGEAVLLRLGIELARDLGGGGGVIDEYRAA